MGGHMLEHLTAELFLNTVSIRNNELKLNISHKTLHMWSGASDPQIKTILFDAPQLILSAKNDTWHMLRAERYTLKKVITSNI